MLLCLKCYIIVNKDEILFYFIFALMKSYFLKLFEYDSFANHLILNAINKVNKPVKAVQLMAHLLAAQQIWLNRCKGLPAPGGALWPDWKAGTFEQIINKNNTAWVSFLNNTETVDFDRIISYKNSKGDSYENKLSDILTHVINHGTHHRAQAGQYLKLAGLDNLPLSDYIFFIR